jgi:hypothetical protein
VPYTVWSHGRLLGHTTLSYAPSRPGIKAGDFEPSELGESLMPVLTGMGPAFEALSQALDRLGPQPGDGLQGGARDTIRLTTEYADLMSISDRLEQLALELRDPSGALVPTAAIGIQDTEHLLALARRDGVLTEEDEQECEPWEPKPARYQIVVELEGARDRMWRSRTPPDE